MTINKSVLSDAFQPSFVIFLIDFNEDKNYRIAQNLFLYTHFPRFSSDIHQGEIRE